MQQQWFVLKQAFTINLYRQARISGVLIQPEAAAAIDFPVMTVRYDEDMIVFELWPAHLTRADVVKDRAFQAIVAGLSAYGW